MVRGGSKTIDGIPSRRSLGRCLFEADLGGKAVSAGAGRGWIDSGTRGSGQVAHVALDVQGDHFEMHRQGDSWSAANAQLGESVASLQLIVQRLLAGVRFLGEHVQSVVPGRAPL